MIKPRNIGIAAVIIIICGGAFLILLTSSSVPVFTVKELMDESRPDSFINRNIQLIGVVQQANTTGFFVTDPDDVNNASLTIFVNATNVEKPAGFESGKTVLIEGKLVSTTNIWKLRASMISTKCPSKYVDET
ncbi:MAG: cytochrome c maturation protein CcmE [Candidatus Heimdallarchaeota archaeon]|nr:MAG: cytochrome c maturation protein CcmE [Candidatus Heimdallarchaeota archaeon]